MDGASSSSRPFAAEEALNKISPNQLQWCLRKGIPRNQLEFDYDQAGYSDNDREGDYDFEDNAEDGCFYLLPSGFTLPLSCLPNFEQREDYGDDSSDDDCEEIIQLIPQPAPPASLTKQEVAESKATRMRIADQVNHGSGHKYVHTPTFRAQSYRGSNRCCMCDTAFEPICDVFACPQSDCRSACCQSCLDDLRQIMPEDQIKCPKCFRKFDTSSPVHIGPNLTEECSICLEEHEEGQSYVWCGTCHATVHRHCFYGLRPFDDAGRVATVRCPTCKSHDFGEHRKV